MRTIGVILAMLAIVLLAGCGGLSDSMKSALKIQTKYTRQYIKATLPGVEDDEMRGVGERLLVNSDKIDAMIVAEEE